MGPIASLLLPPRTNSDAPCARNTLDAARTTTRTPATDSPSAAGRPVGGMPATPLWPPPAPPPPSAGPVEWTLAAWLMSDCGVAGVVADALSKDRPAEVSDLSFVRELGSAGNANVGRAALLALLRRSNILEELAMHVWAGIERLRASRAATGFELQSKFLQDGAGTLSYSGLSTFFRGLEGKIGTPDPKVRDAMEREHRKLRRLARVVHCKQLRHDDVERGRVGVCGDPARCAGEWLAARAEASQRARAYARAECK